MGFIYFKVLVIFLFFSSVKANTIRDTTWRWALETASSLSYSGFNQSLVVIITSDKNSIYFGPKISLSNYYLPLYSIYGINSGIRSTFAQSGRLKAFFNLDYQNSFSKTNKPSKTIKFNTIHEFNFSYGIHYNFSEQFSIGNSIGFGRYLEFYNDIKENRKIIFQGYSGLLKFFIQYEF